MIGHPERAVEHDIRHRACREARGWGVPESWFRVLVLGPGSESWVRVLNPGWVFEKVSLVGGAGSHSPPGAMDSPPPPATFGSLKHNKNGFFELLAASRSFWSRLEAAGIDLGCQGMVLAA